MSQPSISESFDRTLGRAVRTLRKRSSWSQEEVARRMRDKGFPGWSRAVVAALENGNRVVTASELAGLSLALDCGVGELVRFGGQGWIHLGEGIRIRPRALAGIFEGEDPGALDGRSYRVEPTETRNLKRYVYAFLDESHHIPGDNLDGAFLEAAHMFLQSMVHEHEESRYRVGSFGSGKSAAFIALESAARGELEQTIARRLKADPRWIVLVAHHLWGRSPTDERERRASERTSAKHHISREIVRELADLVVDLPGGGWAAIETKSANSRSSTAKGKRS